MSIQDISLADFTVDVEALKGLTQMAIDSCDSHFQTIPEFHATQDARTFIANLACNMQLKYDTLKFHIERVNGMTKRTSPMEKALQPDEYREFLQQLNNAAAKHNIRDVLREATYTSHRIQAELTRMKEDVSTQINVLARKECHDIPMPELEIPYFSGNMEDWLKFWHIFDFAVHSNAGLSKAIKYTHLISKLQGKAAYITDQLDISAESYDFAIEKLHELYGNNQNILKNLSDNIVRLQQASYTHSSIEETLLKLEMLLRRLSFSLADDNSVLLVALLLPKFPVEFTKEVNRIGNIRGEGEIDFESWLKNAKIALKVLKSEEHLTLCSTHIAPSSSDRYEMNQLPNQNHCRDYTSSRTLYPKCKSYTFRGNCPFCNAKHSPENCLLDLKTRTSITRKSFTCWACFANDHPSYQCQFGCYICGTKHHPSLCKPREPRNLLPVSTPFSTALMVGLASIHNSKAMITYMLDTGSDYSFIRRKLAKKFDLPVVGNSRLIISTFGGGQSDSMRYDIARLNLSDLSGKKVIVDAFIIDTIAQNVKVAQPSQLDKSVMKIRKLKTNNGNITVTTPDLLIGIDQYFDIVGKDMKQTRLPSGYHHVSTRLGGIITGSAKKAIPPLTKRKVNEDNASSM